MPSLGKSMVPCERDVINIGIAQCSLAELMADPLIGLVMKSDGVERRDLELLLERVARELSRDNRFPPTRALRLLSNPE
jgi:hypothetical protein